jgi:hypothetical protein
MTESLNDFGARQGGRKSAADPDGYAEWHSVPQPEELPSDGAVSTNGSSFPIALVPASMTPNAYGFLLWGRGADGAKALTGTRSAQELRGLGLTIGNAERWQEFYLHVLAINPRNQAAVSRVELFQDVLNVLKESDEDSEDSPSR